MLKISGLSSRQEEIIRQLLGGRSWSVERREGGYYVAQGPTIRGSGRLPFQPEPVVETDFRKLVTQLRARIALV